MNMPQENNLDAYLENEVSWCCMSKKSGLNLYGKLLYKSEPRLLGQTLVLQFMIPHYSLFNNLPGFCSKWMKNLPKKSDDTLKTQYV